jgi:hypothetical protein
MNSSSTDKKLGTFIRSIETVGMDDNLTCSDPIMKALSYSLITKLRNIPKICQSPHIPKSHLPDKMTWPADDWSHKGALSLKNLGEYNAALHVDVLHPVNELSFPVPKIDKLISFRLGFQNVVSTVHRWTDKILNCVGVKERTCVNAVKQRQSQVFATKAQHEKHTVTCYGQWACRCHGSTSFVNP